MGSGNGDEHQGDFIEMATLSSHVTSAFAQIAIAFRCKTPPSLSSPSIVTCLAASLRKAHNDLAEIARKEDEQNVTFNILRDLEAIKAKDDNGRALNAVEAAIRRMNGGKAGGDVNDESEGGRAHSTEELVREAARYTKMCVAEADKHAPEMADGEELLCPVTEVFGERREAGRAATVPIYVETRAPHIVSKEVTRPHSSLGAALEGRSRRAPSST